MRFKTVCAALLLGAAGSASAAIVTATGHQNFGTTPYSYDFGGGNSITFSLVDNSFFALNPSGVATNGTVQVLSLGAPFYNPPQPTSFFVDRGGSIGPDSLGVFAGYASAAPIPFSIARGLIGLRFDLGGGYQYGFADLAGGTLNGIRFNSDVGAGIGLGAVPEPDSWALLITGFGLSGMALRRRRTAVAAA